MKPTRRALSLVGGGWRLAAGGLGGWGAGVALGIFCALTRGTGLPGAEYARGSPLAAQKLGGNSARKSRTVTMRSMPGAGSPSSVKRSSSPVIR